VAGLEARAWLMAAETAEPVAAVMVMLMAVATAMLMAGVMVMLMVAATAMLMAVVKAMRMEAAMVMLMVAATAAERRSRKTHHQKWTANHSSLHQRSCTRE
jgi:hypothetical protein